MTRAMLVIVALFGCVAMSSALTCGVCPFGYSKIPMPNTSCGYACQTAVKLNCLPQPMYDPIKKIWIPALTPTALQLAAAQPLLCGGSTGKSCPSIACALSTSYAVSGPLGCATASSYIAATALSQTNTDYKDLYTQQIQSYTAAMCAQGWSPNALAAYASQAAEAFASATAYAISQYSIYVCTCCLGNSAAYSSVKASIQAVAAAQALAISQAVAAVTDCDGNVLSLGSGIAQALASSIELAIDEVFVAALALKGGCKSTGLQSTIKSAVAKASACAFAEAFALAVDSSTPKVSAGCATTVAVSGSDWTTMCKPITDCPCTAAGYGYNNLGFEEGSFAGTPSWIVSATASPAPAVLVSASLNLGGPSPVTLSPAEGKYFAGIPAGCSENSIITTVQVPPCASSITASYVFKCNDYSPFNDAGDLSITLTDYFTNAVVATLTIKPTCMQVGQSPSGFCSSDSSIAPAGATSGGAWTTATLSGFSSGLYNLVITAKGRNALDCACASWLYVDGFTFA